MLKEKIETHTTIAPVKMERGAGSLKGEAESVRMIIVVDHIAELDDSGLSLNRCKFPQQLTV